MEKIVMEKEKLNIIAMLKKILWDVDEPELPKQDPEIAEKWRKVWAGIDKKEAQLTKGMEKKKGKSTMVEQIHQNVSSNVKDTRIKEQSSKVQSKEHEEENIIE